MVEKGKRPHRIETDLCPGLEDALRAVVADLDGLAAAIRGMAHEGSVGSEGAALEVERVRATAADALDRWVPERPLRPHPPECRCGACLASASANPTEGADRG